MQVVPTGKPGAGLVVEEGKDKRNKKKSSDGPGVFNDFHRWVY